MRNLSRVQKMAIILQKLSNLHNLEYTAHNDDNARKILGSTMLHELNRECEAQRQKLLSELRRV